MKNKKILLALVSTLVVLFQSCSFFDYDTLDWPAETLEGTITDQDGEGIRVEFGGGARITLMDYGSHDNPEPQYLTVKNDGSFINTKIFESTYDIIAEGPFVPMESNTIESFTVKGTKSINFVVEPFLKLDLIGEPVVNPDGSISVSFIMGRGTENEDYHTELQDVRLFISTTQYVGNSDKLDLQSPTISGSDATAMIGQQNTMTTNIVGVDPLDQGRPYYLRVGARLNYTGDWGSNSYCYTPVVKVVFTTK
ncbi:MAG: DUF3823 domain-containing protein [Rikenellaceae bacterium]